MKTNVVHVTDNYFDSCHHSIIVSVKTRLKAILETKYADVNEVLPNQLNDARFDVIRDIANEEIARFLRSLLDSYCSFLLLNEYKLSREESGNVFINSRLLLNAKLQ